MIDPHKKKSVAPEQPVFSEPLLKLLDWMLRKSDQGLYRRYMPALMLALWSASQGPY